MQYLLVWNSFLDVGLDHYAVLRRKQVFQRLERGERAFRVLLAVAARKPDPAHHLVADDDRKAADEGGEAALEAELDTEGLVPRQRGPAGRLSEEVRRALVAGGGEGLVPGDLRPGDARAVHALEREWITTLVAHAYGLRDADLLSLALRGLHHGARILQLELERRSHMTWYTALI